MIEKRFVNKGRYIHQYGEYWCGAGGEHCADVIATALNELIEENEKLNKKLQIYKTDGIETLNDLQRCYENAKKSMKRIDILEEENEQLKQEIETLQEQLAHIGGVSE